MKTGQKVRFQLWDCDVILKRYGNQRMAIQLVDSRNEPVATATVNVPEWMPKADNLVLIKSWSENEGMLEALEKAGIVKATGVTVPCGFVEAHEAVYFKEEAD